MVRPQISSEAALPGYVQRVAHRAAVLSTDGKVSHGLLPSILSNHTAVWLMRIGAGTCLCVLQHVCVGSVSHYPFDVETLSDLRANDAVFKIYKYFTTELFFLFYMNSCRKIIKAATQCNCVKSVNPIRSRALGSSSLWCCGWSNFQREGK